MKHLKSVSCQRIMHAGNIAAPPPCSEITPWWLPSKFEPGFLALCEYLHTIIIE